MAHDKTTRESAVHEGKLLAESAANIEATLAAASTPVAGKSVAELEQAGEWAELNDRFYQTLAFGTGGLRGRTIGKIVTAAERGTPTHLGRPEFPCVGTNAMNFYNISRATQGLVAYLQDWFEREKISGHAEARDRARHALFLARNSPSSRPSRGGKWLRCLRLRRAALDAGAFLRRAASARQRRHRHHRQPQPAARQRLQSLFRRRRASGRAARQRDHRESERGRPAPPNGKRGSVTTLSRGVDEAYLERLETLVLDPELVRAQSDLRIVFTPIHGTGGVIIKPMLDQARLQVRRRAGAGWFRRPLSRP